MAKYRSRYADRINRVEALSLTLSRLTKPLFGKRGLSDGAIAREWDQIVGPMIADHSQPERITYQKSEGCSGLLHLRVDHSAMATELQHLEPQLLERINGYFGFKAVSKMHFIHGPVNKTCGNNTVSQYPTAPEQNSFVAEAVNNIRDDDLRGALNRLGNAVYREGKKKK